MLDKFNVIQARMTSLQRELAQASKKPSLAEPYAFQTHPELLPQVLLRTRLLPEQEEEQAAMVRQLQDVDADRLEAWNRRLQQLAQCIEDLQAQHRFNLRYAFDGQEDDQGRLKAIQAKPVDEEDAEEKAMKHALEVMLRFMHAGTTLTSNNGKSAQQGR